ncbi:hypothetical protein PF008_g14625 [Phytophthora fragariae]|uniref:Uncharacterized protein n=1 Tax=Phytophthora fragariae TaxID=53985 RepID=A0A6G0RGG7_9STRA|nr:hypothetical protein PF008_g14625 [Phytophthora fragariae]
MLRAVLYTGSVLCSTRTVAMSITKRIKKITPARRSRSNHSITGDKAIPTEPPACDHAPGEP